MNFDFFDPNELIQPRDWVEALMRGIGNTPIPDVIIAFAYGIIFIAMAIKLLEIFQGNTSNLLMFAVKTCAAFTLILSHGQIGNGVIQMWYSSYDAIGTSATSGISGSLDQLGQNLGQDFTAVANADLSANSAAGMLERTNIVNGATFGATAGTALATGALTATRFALKPLMSRLKMVILPVIVVYLMFIFMTGFVVVIGTLFIPLVAASIVTPVGTSTISGYFSTQLSSIITLLCLPLLFTFFVDRVIVAPLTQLGDIFSGGAQSIEAQVEALDELPITALDDQADPGYYQQTLNWIKEKVGGFTTSLADTTLRIVDGITGAAITMIIGIIATIFLTYQLNNVIATYTGKMVSAGGNAAAAIIGGSVAFGGFGGNTSSSDDADEKTTSGNETSQSDSSSGSVDNGNAGYIPDSNAGGGSDEPTNQPSPERTAPRTPRNEGTAFEE
jgi:hypothetical protein